MEVQSLTGREEGVANDRDGAWRMTERDELAMELAERSIVARASIDAICR